MQDVQCEQCKAVQPAEAAFCSQCGAKLAAAAAQEIIAPAVEPANPRLVAVMEMDYPKAPLGKRLLASIVDSFIGSLPLLPGVLFFANHMEAMGVAWMAVTLCWALFYHFCKDGFAGGQSYGKRMNDLMVVSLRTNEPCTKGKSALRALALAIPYVGGLIECLMVLFTDKGRRLGDRFASTQVIEVKEYQK